MIPDLLLLALLPNPDQRVLRRLRIRIASEFRQNTQDKREMLESKRSVDLKDSHLVHQTQCFPALNHGIRCCMKSQKECEASQERSSRQTRTALLDELTFLSEGIVKLEKYHTEQPFCLFERDPGLLVDAQSNTETPCTFSLSCAIQRFSD